MRTQPWHPPHLSEPRTVLILERHAQILDALAEGLSGPQTAARLSLSLHTVRSHQKKLYRLMGARSGAHAVALVCSGQVRVDVRVDHYRAPKAAA